MSLLLSALLMSVRKVYSEAAPIEPVLNHHSPALKRKTIKSTKRELVLSAGLSIISILFFCLFIIILYGYFDPFIYFFALFLAVYWVFFILPNKQSGRLAVEAADLLAPLFIGLLNKSKNATAGLENLLLSREKTKENSKHYSKSEIIELLSAQKNIYDGRGLGRDLAVAINSLSVASKDVEDFLVSIDQIHVVDEKENAGPILIDELHKSGRKIFPVKNKVGAITGTIRLDDMIDLSDDGKKVSDVARNEIFHLDEDDNIAAVIDGFLENGATMFMVRRDEEDIGAVYLQDILSQLFGRD